MSTIRWQQRHSVPQECIDPNRYTFYSRKYTESNLFNPYKCFVGIVNDQVIVIIFVQLDLEDKCISIFDFYKNLYWGSENIYPSTNAILKSFTNMCNTTGNNYNKIKTYDREAIPQIACSEVTKTSYQYYIDQIPNL